jgi:Skp family chaperone for outer membrane proteins
MNDELKLERELAVSQAQVKEIRSALGDDGRRTHKEILEMAFKASGWKVWKEKYIDLRNAHIAEGQDPAGTIWEHADKLQKELKEAQAEVKEIRAALGDDLLEWKISNCTLSAEVARLQKELDATCNAEELRQERETRKRAEAEVESLREKLDTAIEIAKDALWYARIYENEIHFNKMDVLYQKLVALKNK